jgi:hypothetical protein
MLTDTAIFWEVTVQLNRLDGATYQTVLRHLIFTRQRLYSLLHCRTLHERRYLPISHFIKIGSVVLELLYANRERKEREQGTEKVACTLCDFFIANKETTLPDNSSGLESETSSQLNIRPEDTSCRQK